MSMSFRMELNLDKKSNMKFPIIIGASVILFTIFLLYVVIMTGVQIPDKSEGHYILTIPMGASLSQVADSLVFLGIAESKREVIRSGKMLGVQRMIKTGKYRLKAGSSLYDVFNLITSGEVEPVVITILEGWNSRKIAEELRKEFKIDIQRFDSLLSDSVFIAKLGIDATDLEGYLFPETYHFTYGMSEKMMIGWMVRQFRDKFGSEERKRADEMSMTMNEVITLASIIEGESVHDEERPVVSSVYHNRLKKNMRLQADPTIQFLLPDGPRRLSNQDLFIKSPYNTYRHSGLPPGPIGSPGLASIRAALWPAETEYIYFVATGDGYHTFTSTLEDHNRAKQKLQKLRREYDKQLRNDKVD
ncbi:endolytic transglycosylase MltG [Candidatus Marinimicrobia bacterium MT.SAG.3]|nr:endolytic transglycosylase MltG [Candidatus Marinimicrobia bacterium MT.SAG.3]